MALQIFSTLHAGFRSGVLLVFCFGFVASPAQAQDEQASDVRKAATCSIDLSNPGKMRDIVSNALMRGLDFPESDVQTFLRGAESRYTTGQELLEAAARNFKVNEADLTAEVKKFKHCNCKHGPLDDRPSESQPGKIGVEKTLEIATSPRNPVVHEDRVDEARVMIGADRQKMNVSKFAEDVTLHVVVHELGHALIREFDLPVLGNEESMADAFATYYLTTYLPDRALDVLTARTKSLMIEAAEVPRQEWSIRGEHNNDARRAFQIAALAIAADPEKYHSVATGIGMSEGDIRKSRDYGTEIHRSWRRVLHPLWMPVGEDSNEVRIKYDSDNEIISHMRSSGLTKEIESIVRRFDWHSQISINFVGGDGGASWSRSRRTIDVHSDYIRRFIKQGEIGKFSGGE